MAGLSQEWAGKELADDSEAEADGEGGGTEWLP